MDHRVIDLTLDDEDIDLIGGCIEYDEPLSCTKESDITFDDLFIDQVGHGSCSVTTHEESAYDETLQVTATQEGSVYDEPLQENVIDLTLNDHSDDRRKRQRISLETSSKSRSAKRKKNSNDHSTDLTEKHSIDSDDKASVNPFSHPNEEIHYYHNNKALPIYDYPKKGFTKEKIIHTLLDSIFDARYLCSDHPVSIENNVAFVVDMTKLKCKDDMRADDLGTWVCTGSRLLKIEVEEEEGIYHIVQGAGTTVNIRRQYHVHGTDKDLHRMIAFLDSTGDEAISSSRCLIQYWFDGNEHAVKVKSHGNSKRKSEPYCRTHPSTINMLKDEAKVLLPKAAVRKVCDARGGIMDAGSMGELPRNREQVSNIRRKMNSQVPICSNKSSKDPLFMVMEQSKMCSDSFVRIVTASPEPMCILATEQQLIDLERFTTNSNSFSIASVDPTFSLGDFSVTCVSYRHQLTYDCRTNESPIMLGPVLVHQRKLFETYHFFASSLIGLLPSLDRLLAFGTDGETALALAFSKQFQHAIHLRCFRHMKQNIQRKLSVDLGLPQEQTVKIMRDIFGGKCGPTFYEGLVDASTQSEFDAKLSQLKHAWSDELLSTVGLSFHAWLTKYHASEIKECMLKPVRVAAGLGDPPSEFCTNDSEAINSTLKQFLHFKKSDWPTFNEKIKAFVIEQQKEVEKAILGMGQYRVKREYQQFCVSSSKWFTSFTKEQKQHALAKFHKASVDDKHVESTSISHATDTDGTIEKQLSVDIVTASKITDLPTLCLRQMWAKAFDLLTDGKVVPAPCSVPTARMVASSSLQKPHFVSPKKDQLFQCDDDCPAFLQRHVCSHVIAAAEDNNMLKEYLECYGKFVRTPKGKCSATPNFTRLSMVNLPRGSAGRKSPKAPKKKAVKRKQVIPDEQRRDAIPVIEPVPESSKEMDHVSGNAPVPVVHRNSYGTTSWDPAYACGSYGYSNMHAHMAWNWDPSGYYPYPAFHQGYMHWPANNDQEEPLPSVEDSESTSSNFTSTGANTNPFHIKFLNGRIKVCAGCKGPHMKNADGGLLQPPHDICIARRENITYLNPRTKLECSKEGNCYYHVNKACLLKKNPQFSVSQLICPDDVVLENSHKQLLRDTIGFIPRD